MIGNSNYPVFYMSQAKRRQREQLILVAIISSFLLIGLIILAIGYAQISSSNNKGMLSIVNKAQASYNNNSVEESLVEVIVPLVDIAPRTKISYDVLTRKKVPAEYARNAIKNFSEIIGLYNREALYNGQMINKNNISPKVGLNKIIDKIPAGYRAVTITLSPTKSIEGWLQAGTSVDVYWISKATDKAKIYPIVQNAYVISADRVTVEEKNAEEKEGKNQSPIPVTASLLVTRDDALKIGLASTQGELTLSLRGDEEKGVTLYKERGMTTRDLLHITDLEKVKVKPTVRITDKKGGIQKYYFEGDKLVPVA